MSRLRILVPLLLIVSTARTVHAGSKCGPAAGTNPYADPALADPHDAEAEHDHQTGRSLHRASDYAGAIKAFTAGYVRDPVPIFLYAIAQSYREAHDYEHAIAEYQLFLTTAKPAPGPALTDLINCFVREMQDEMGHAAATLSPTGIPPDTDGALGTATSSSPASSSPTVREPDTRAPWYHDSIGWVAVASGVAIGAVGGYLFVDAADLRDQAATEDREDVRDQLRDRAASRQRWGYVVAGVGAAALIGGIVKLAIAPTHHRSALALSIGVGGVGVAGAF